MDHPDLPGTHPESGVIPLFCHKLHLSAGAPGKLSPSSRAQLNIMYHNPQRYIANREGVSHLNFTVRSRAYRMTHLQTLRSQDVPLLPICIIKQRYPCRPVWIILDCGHPCRDTCLITPEIDHPVMLSVAAALVVGRDPSIVVPAPGAPLLDQQ